jgi:hypothetical protein
MPICVLLLVERRADERERRRQREAAPREKEKCAGKHSTPMRHEQYDRVANDRNHIEGNQRASMTKTIRNDATWPRVNRAEQCLDCVVQPDDERRRTKHLEILRNEAHPQLLAGANNNDREQQDDNVPLEPEELRQPHCDLCLLLR